MEPDIRFDLGQSAAGGESFEERAYHRRQYLRRHHHGQSAHGFVEFDAVKRASYQRENVDTAARLGTVALDILYRRSYFIISFVPRVHFGVFGEERDIAHREYGFVQPGKAEITVGNVYIQPEQRMVLFRPITLGVLCVRRRIRSQDSRENVDQAYRRKHVGQPEPRDLQHRQTAQQPAVFVQFDAERFRKAA